MYDINLIEYKNHAIFIDSNTIKIIDPLGNILDKTTYLFYKKSDILKITKRIINDNVQNNRRIDIYA